MKKITKHFLRLIVFYLLLYAFARLIFLLFNKEQDPLFSWGTAMPSFFYGMRMDLSVIAYCLLPSLLFAGLFMIRPMKWIRTVEYIYLFFITVVICTILPSNIIVYHFWNNLLNYRALTYLSDPKEVVSSFTILQMIGGTIVLAVYSFVIYVIFRRIVYRDFEIENAGWIKKSLSWMAMLFISVVMMRGGLQMLPMNESLVSYSDDNFINQSAANPAWHLFNDIYRAGVFEGNPFELLPEDSAKQKVKELFACEKDSFPHIFTTKTPNIVVLILESFTADVVGAMGGEKGISPTIDRLVGEGVFFDSIYASGTRTDQGIVSILNGWPATPYYSIMRSTDKSNKLPSITKLFLERGYSTSFLYGGESNFSNMNTYCINQKFQTIIDDKNFDSSVPHGRWGMHDEYVLSRQLELLSKSKEPFFSTLMTLSNHEPFDVPGPPRFPGNNDPDRFRNSAAYTDASLGEYFRKAKELPWYKNTLFIIVADHGHSLPQHRNIYFPDCHRIPLLFFGEVIKPEFRGAFVNKLGCHHDIPGTLLPQLGMDAAGFEWSKNLLNPTVKPFAYYQIDQLAGWIDTKYWFGYSYSRKKFLARSYDIPQTHMEKMQGDGWAFVQELFECYRRY